MSIESLIALLPPPHNPVEVPSADDWIAIEKLLKVSLPNDYRAFLGIFGTGIIDDFIWILSPVSRNEYLNLCEEMDSMLKALRELRTSEEHCAYSLFPDPGGLLPFGKTENGDGLYWLTVGDPSRWCIVVNAAREPHFEEFACDMTHFLCELLTRQVHCSIFPEAFPSMFPQFSPAGEDQLG